MSAPAAGRDPWRPLRYALRLPWLLLHVLVLLPLVLLLISLPTRRLRLPSGEPLEYRLIRRWQGGLMLCIYAAFCAAQFAM